MIELAYDLTIFEVSFNFMQGLGIGCILIGGLINGVSEFRKTKRP